MRNKDPIEEREQVEKHRERKKKEHKRPSREHQRNPARVAFRARRSSRGSNMGRMMEERVLAMGNQLVIDGTLESFTYHKPNSPEDLSGRDFTAVMTVGKERVERSFGVTISGGRKVNYKRNRYPDTDLWSLPWNTKDRTIRRKIQGLFGVDGESPPEASDDTMRDFLAGSV